MPRPNQVILRRFPRTLRRRRGTSLVSYGILVGLISVAVLGAVTGLGGRIETTYVALEARASAVANHLVCKRLEGTIRKADGHCFAPTGEVLAQADGQDLCARLGGRLPVIATQAESTYFATEIAGGQRAWIGLSDRAEEGVFRWSDGRGLTFTAWEEGEPNDQGGEDCVEINHNVTGAWNDQSCADPRPIYCEIE